MRWKSTCVIASCRDNGLTPIIIRPTTGDYSAIALLERISPSILVPFLLVQSLWFTAKRVSFIYPERLYIFNSAIVNGI